MGKEYLIFQNAPKKFKDYCYNCNNVGHWSKDCWKSNNVKGQNAHAYIIENHNLFDNAWDINLSTIASKYNLVGNTKEW